MAVIQHTTPTKHDGLFGSVTFDNSYARLPECFYAKLNPVPVPQPRLIKFNRDLAESLGLSAASPDDAEATAIFAGNRIPEGAEPIAQAYAGHQFGQFVPQLGDGRAILLGEVIDRHGKRQDIQFKGSGQTPFSRRGDGRAPLGPVIREYILSEAMHALGIPTTRSLAAVTTGEPVFRETTLPGAVLTRVASSHIRVGTFEYFAARQDKEALKTLADYTIARHYPELQESSEPYSGLLKAVMARQSMLVSQWMGIGFIHGVMNTDNMTISGETIDYGPCAFMDRYDPDTVFSSIDHHGRYAYANQKVIGGWNLARFAEALLPLFDDKLEQAITKAEETIAAFPDMFAVDWLDIMTEKLGIEEPQPGDKALVEELLQLLQQEQTDFTNAFRALSHVDENKAYVEASIGKNQQITGWTERWMKRLESQQRKVEASLEAMRGVNPAYIPRNHQVEKAIAAAVQDGDFTAMDRLMDILSTPYTERAGFEAYTRPPEPEERVYQTFCGT